VTRDQKQYEWLVDIIKDVEEDDKLGILQTHIFITQLQHKFDLRATMMVGVCFHHGNETSL